MARYTHLWFIGPALILIVLILVLPILLATAMSFTDYALGNKAKIIRLRGPSQVRVWNEWRKTEIRCAGSEEKREIA